VVHVPQTTQNLVILRHVVDLQRTAKKCTMNYNARAEPLYWSLMIPKLERKWYQGPVSRKPRKLFGPVKPFLVNLYINGEVYTPETSCMKGTFVYIKTTWIKQLCDHKVRNFAVAFRVRKLFGTFEKQSPGPELIPPQKVRMAWTPWKVYEWMHFFF